MFRLFRYNRQTIKGVEWPQYQQSCPFTGPKACSGPTAGKAPGRHRLCVTDVSILTWMKKIHLTSYDLIDVLFEQCNFLNKCLAVFIWGIYPLYIGKNRSLENTQLELKSKLPITLSMKYWNKEWRFLN